MIGYVMVGTNNLNDAITFYDKVLEVIGLDRNETIEDDYAAYGAKGTKDIEFYVTKPFNKKKCYLWKWNTNHIFNFIKISRR